MLKEDLAELLDRIGPAIVVVHSNGGPSGWLVMEARPNLVKGLLAIEPGMGITDVLAPLITFKPALAAGEKITTVEQPSEGAGLTPCPLQPEDNVHKVPAYAGKKMLFVVSPQSPMFTPNVHCSVHTLNQLGADAKLARLKEDYRHPGQRPLHERGTEQRGDREEDLHPLAVRDQIGSQRRMTVVNAFGTRHSPVCCSGYRRERQQGAADLSQARATDPVALGEMVGNPPPPDKQIRFEDGSSYRFPQWRWSFSHWRELHPTVAVSRGPTPDCRW